ncbi:sn-glycerol-1-phosphate dehydrogenase [Paenibacillus sp. HB172176]|uniref:sn-glycerol-1-phosphate dehydrogenase n=1 Tax=Paenibacillus sp. HB172176 TaxID=2493690 RepID=UPI001F0EE2F8|nr:sn-glycerol-1-phosphate dehydrogenase [Paenibacillus sp. HB172176]
MTDGNSIRKMLQQWTTQGEGAASQWMKSVDDKTRQALSLAHIRIDKGVLSEVAPYLTDHSCHSTIIVADSRTYEAAGLRLEKELKAAGIRNATVLINPNSLGDVVADEASIVQLLLAIQESGAELVIAAGSGTLHDISRYAAYTAGIPFLSVPTAPSVDGFTSKGAPILIRGEKITIQAIGPEAIFADLDVLMKAPSALVAAGFGDMLGKFTSLFDWRFGVLTADEPFSKLAEDMTFEALMSCVNAAEEIGRRSEEGIRILTEALIASGIAMLLFGSSHPASGGEHHLSHYWEMDDIRCGRRQHLHGAKVGAACALISKLYHLAGEQSPEQLRLSDTICAQWDSIRQAIQSIPRTEQLQEWLQVVGGAGTPDELGFEAEMVERSLKEAHLIRMSRHTLLRALNEAGATIDI